MTNRQIELYENYKSKNWKLPRIAKQIKVSVQKLEEYEKEDLENELRWNFVHLRSKGFSIEDIAEKLNISLSYIIELSGSISPDILSNYKTLAIDKIQSDNFVTKSKRIEIVGEQFKALKDELSKRDFKDVPTEKLLILFLKYGEFLKNSEIKIGLKSVELDEYGSKKVEKWSI